VFFVTIEAVLEKRRMATQSPEVSAESAASPSEAPRRA
jgi:hypothetical protein